MKEKNIEIEWRFIYQADPDYFLPKIEYLHVFLFVKKKESNKTMVVTKRKINEIIESTGFSFTYTYEINKVTEIKKIDQII